MRRGVGPAEAFGAQPLAADVTPAKLREMLTFPEEWGPSEWGEHQCQRSPTACPCSARPATHQPHG